MTTPAEATSIRHEVVVEVPIERAFSIFTQRFGTFKPREHNMLSVEIAATVFEPRQGGMSMTAARTAANAAGRASSPMSLRIGSSSAGTSTPTGKSRPTSTKPAKLRCDSSPRRRTARASSWSIATSIDTAPAGRQCAEESTPRAAGRSTCADSPTSWPRESRQTAPSNDNPRTKVMAPIVSSIDIARPQDEVFAYVTDPSRFAEWQTGVVGGSMEGGKTPSVGSKCLRRVASAARSGK